MNCDIFTFLELNQEILARGSMLRFQAKGGSMRPFIKDGDILEIEPIDSRKIRLGDVVFYQIAGGHAVIHRVIRRFLQDKKIFFITKGDSNPDCEEAVFMEKVLGRVTAIERNGQRIKFSSGLNRLISVFYARLSPFSKWFYPLLRKIKLLVRSKAAFFFSLSDSPFKTKYAERQGYGRK